MESGSRASLLRGCRMRRTLFALVAVTALVAAAFMCLGFGANAAWAQAASSKPSVLLVDAGLGDYELAGLHWLGEGSEVVADDAGRMLTTAKDPAWWGDEATAPSTFLLGSASSRATTPDDIAWALDKIRESGAEPRTFVVAVGATGLSLREYVQDLASQKQSARADVVGLGFCGTPQSGYSAMGTYPEQTLWESVAQSAGRQVDDLKPGSAYLQNLNGGTLPNITKTLSLGGAAGDLGFGATDGAGTEQDFALPSAVSDQVEVSRSNTTISRQINLTGLWEPFTSAINYSGREVDAQLVERLSAIDSYAVSADVQAIVRDFYQAWYNGGAPVTHNSNVLLLDLSGSMVEPIDASGDKLAAAKEAARQYLQAMQDCSGLPQSAPMDVAVFGFNETLSKVAEGYDKGAIDALEGMAAHSETNIGIALDQALDTLKNAPTCADKHVLLLSDGEATRGKSDDEMLSGAVAQAAAAGIVIDTIGFGDVGESDAGFLKQVADATGGMYYQANDTYSLKVNFLKSYYSSLGLSLVDEEVAGGGPASQAVGAVDDHTSALQVGIVGRDKAPNATLSCNGAPLDASQYSVKQENGFTSVQCVNPPAGEYTLELSDAAGAAHVFAVKQQGISHAVYIAGEQVDYSLYLLIGTGVLLVAAIAGVIIFSSRKSKAKAAPASTLGATASQAGPANKRKGGR